MRQAHANAAARLRDLHAYDHVYRDFAEVDRLVRQLAARYEPLVYGTHPSRGHADSYGDRHRARPSFWLQLLLGRRQ